MRFARKKSEKNLDRMEKEQPTKDAPTKCAGDCGFFGNPATNNYCSVCWKERYTNEEMMMISGRNESMKKEENNQKTDPKLNASSVLVTSAVPAVSKSNNVTPLPSPAIKPKSVLASPALSSVSAMSFDSAGNKKPKCLICSKKLSLASAFPCKCEHTFCSAHRLAEAHNCTFDYKSSERSLLAKQNPLISASKVDKI